MNHIVLSMKDEFFSTLLLFKQNPSNSVIHLCCINLIIALPTLQISKHCFNLPLKGQMTPNGQSEWVGWLASWLAGWPGSFAYWAHVQVRLVAVSWCQKGKATPPLSEGSHFLSTWLGEDEVRNRLSPSRVLQACQLLGSVTAQRDPQSSWHFLWQPWRRLGDF